MTGRRVRLLAGFVAALAVLAGAFVVSASGYSLVPATEPHHEQQARQPRADTASAPSAPATPPIHRPRNVSYVFPVAHCKTSYARSHHDYPAADILAARGCRFVSPVTGHVDEVMRKDRWKSAASPGATRGGRFVSVIGVDGVRYYGSHLRSVASGIHPGAAVKGGQVLGRVGNSGDARGVTTHLHFGISWPTKPGRWWIRRGEVWPQRFLDAWHAGRDLSPARAVARVKKHTNAAHCHHYC